MLLSVPVQSLSRILTRRSRGLAVVVAFPVVVGLIVVGALFVVRRLMAHFATLAHALPALAVTGRRYLLVVLVQLNEWASWLARRSRRPRRSKGTSPRVSGARGRLAGRPLRPGLGGLWSRRRRLRDHLRRGLPARGLAQLKVAYLTATPRCYRHDARVLWNAFDHSFWRYMSGLFLDLFIQGAVFALAL
jgi:predicted PurR-regulated permease PerM